MFGNVYNGKRVLVTGHTGFKGSWLCAWLQQLGAEVCGAALLPDQTPDHFSLLDLNYRSELCDICCYEKFLKIMQDFQPEIVFHLAAQPLVRQSYADPRNTFAANVLGSVNVLESCRYTESVRAVVMVTTDKCYSNPETERPFREEDPLGGHDPYSASKGAAEIAAASYRLSFFAPEGRIALATARAGNVIGGGDWAKDRLLPDLVRSAASGETSHIRFPGAVRPWQHVLEALSGYLLLGQKLYVSGQEFASAWNFGPVEKECYTVEDVIHIARKYWEKISFVCESPEEVNLHEASHLVLDCSKAEKVLQWHPVWNTEHSVGQTVCWYHDYYEKGKVTTFSMLEEYVRDARKKGVVWVE